MRKTRNTLGFAVLFLALACQPPSPVEKGAEQVRNEISNAAPTPAADPFASIPRISVEELTRALKEGDVVIVDVRPAEAFAAERIKGAVSMPEEETLERAGELLRDRLVVTYCA